MVGDVYVGKSSLMIRFAVSPSPQDDNFADSYTATIGVDFVSR